MVSYDKVAGSEGFQRLYEAAIEVSGIEQRVQSLKGGNVSVLDFGGRKGELGRRLIDRFGKAITYVNIDLDSESLQESPGITIVGDFAELPDVLPKKSPKAFDYIFQMNSSGTPSPIDTSVLRNKDTPPQVIDAYNHAYFTVIERTVYIAALNSMSLASNRSNIVVGGSLGEGFLGGMQKFYHDHDFHLIKEVPIDVGDEAVRLLVMHDANVAGQGLNLEYMQERFELHRNAFRVLVYRGPRKWKPNKIRSETRRYRVAYRQAQRKLAEIVEESFS